MLTRFGKIISRYCDADAYPLFKPSSSSGLGMSSFKDRSGTDRYFLAVISSTSDTLSTNYNNATVLIGSNNDPESEDDFMLHSPINSGFSSNTGSIIREFDSVTKTLTISRTYTITNTGATDLIVKEIGKLVTARYSSTLDGQVSTNTSTVLQDRTVLDNPLTIAPGESGTIKYGFRYNVEF